MKKSFLRMLVMMVGIIGLTVGAGFALSKPAPVADRVAILQATGMTCGSCAARIQAALGGMQGVDSVQVDVANAKVLVMYHEQSVKPEALAEKVTQTGFRSAVLASLTMEQFQAVTGGSGQNAQQQGGCGGDCCNKKRK